MTRRSTVLAIVCACWLSLPLWAQFDTRPDASNGPAGPNVVPEGSTFIVRLDDTLDTNKLQPGKRFKAKLAEDLVAPNGAVIPRGKKVKGHVSESTEGMRGRILLSFDEIETNHGSMPLVATVVDVPGEHGVKMTEEGEIEHKGPDTKRVIETTAVGAGVGAAAGAAAGGGRGAAIGAGAGGLIGGVSGALIGRDLKLQKGQQLELRLDRGLQVP